MTIANFCAIYLCLWILIYVDWCLFIQVHQHYSHIFITSYKITRTYSHILHLSEITSGPDMGMSDLSETRDYGYR